MKNSILENKIQNEKIEKYIVQSEIVLCIIILLVEIFFKNRFRTQFTENIHTNIQIMSAFLIIVFFLIKLLNLKIGKIKNVIEFSIYKGIELTLIIIYLSISDLGIYFLFLIPVLISIIGIIDIDYESEAFIIYTFVLTLLMFFLVRPWFFTKLDGYYANEVWSIIYIIFLYVFGFVLNSVYVLYYNNLKKKFDQKENELQIANENYEELNNKILNCEETNSKLSELNKQLEEYNKKLTSSVAELFTMQQITQAISSIFDIKELLKFVNDIILGVMGVSTSTIILYDEKRDRLKVNISNIRSTKELALISDNINSPIIKDSIKEGSSIIENEVDEKKYIFTAGRGINSLVCVPLISKGKLQGMVMIEHTYKNAFDNDNVRLLEIIGQQVSIAIENVGLYNKLHEMAIYDSLTKVYNRLYFQQKIEEEINRARIENYDVSLAIFDIDHFKRFNDTYGHLFGDRVLQTMAREVKNNIRNKDIFARYGGEEFIVLMPETDLDVAVEKAEKIRQIISKTEIREGDICARINVSIGVSSFPHITTSLKDLLKTADDALYHAKETGRNKVVSAGLLKDGK